jgi:hypothetical protein
MNHQTTATRSTIDLLSHVNDDHLLKRLSQSISKATHIPASSVFLLGLGVFSSVATRSFSVAYQYNSSIPIGLYTVIESPSGVGKSHATRIFQNPFFKQYKTAMAAQLEPSHALFCSNATPEALENSLIATKGFFSCVSSEQGLFNSLLGLSYGDGKASNNDLILNGFDAGFVNSMRITRQGYNGVAAGGVTLFAQDGSIEKVLNTSNGTGLSERFLMLSEPHNLGKRNHLESHAVDTELLNLYEQACNFATIANPIEFESCKELSICTEGWRLINTYRNHIEGDLVDGGRYSHISLRGAAAKCDQQIMKVAANLHILNSSVAVVAGCVISLDCVEAAIKIVHDLIEHQLTMLADKGLAGKNAAHDAILRMFDKAKVLTDRQIIMSRGNVAPFKDATGNKYQLIRTVLFELVELGILQQTGLDTKAIYKLTPATTATTATRTPQDANLLGSS